MFFGMIVSFGRLRAYLESLTALNPGTTTRLLETDSVFERAFMALGMCVDSFQHTPGVVGLDACHIKASYGGVLLVMTVLDGNGQVYPAAIGIAESENTQTWFSFLSLVSVAFHIGDGGRGLVFLSDREKGIDAAVSSLFPNAAHSFCVYHIQKNVKVNFHTTLDGLLFEAAHAMNEDSFKEALRKMKALHKAAYKYVKKIKAVRWARSAFPARRFGHVTSNISESMNWWLEDAPRLDPVSLFSTYLKKLNPSLTHAELNTGSFLLTLCLQTLMKSSKNLLRTLGTSELSDTVCLSSKFKDSTTNSRCVS